MILLGLTGSIGMGKSTTAKIFSEYGVPVHDSDEAVHRLYRGKAAPLVEAAFPGTTRDGIVDRSKLAEKVLGDAVALRRLEEIVHPLIRADATAYLKPHHAAGAPLAVLDIPLLYETDGRDRVDLVVVVSAPYEVQRERVLARPGMTEEKFQKILGKQVPDAEKRALADFVIDTSHGMESVRVAVADIIEKLTGKRPRRVMDAVSESR
ncbi:MAG: dephospho-CoA kinase [Mesorhizobium sp.]|nr:dephospho-CoA kinase [Mesorhizobium sp.]MBL8578196.1 dephospho-CoA kinase [Mesorhizobium sp.]